MSTNAIITAANLDINKVSFGDIRLNKAGGKTVPIKYNGQNLQIRVPKTTYPMGVNIKETDNGMNYTLSATLRNCDPYAKDRATGEAGELGSLYNFLLDLQDKLLRTSVENSVKWFSKARKEDSLYDNMKMVLNPSVEKIDGTWVPSGKYPPSFRMKVPVYNGEVSMDVSNQDGKPIEVTTDNLADIFPKRVEASIVVAPSVYVSGQAFGVTWRITYARVSPPQRLTGAQVFADEIEEETKTTSSSAQVSELPAEAYEQEQEVESPKATPPAASPPPAPAKNRRRVAVPA